jgi:hypothetical protein
MTAQFCTETRRWSLSKPAVSLRPGGVLLEPDGRSHDETIREYDHRLIRVSHTQCRLKAANRRMKSPKHSQPGWQPRSGRTSSNRHRRRLLRSA